MGPLHSVTPVRVRMRWPEVASSRGLCYNAQSAGRRGVAMTQIAIAGQAFHLNGQPTYRGRRFQGHPIEGLLFNVRAVQATFDDANPATRHLWAYPDTGVWDPQRNTDAFCAALPSWRDHGILAFTINFQGGGPYTCPRSMAPTTTTALPRGQCHSCLRGAYSPGAGPRRCPGHGRHRGALLLGLGTAHGGRAGHLARCPSGARLAGQYRSSQRAHRSGQRGGRGL